MSALIADSLAGPIREEPDQVKTMAFGLQINPANPGMRFHKREGAKDKDFWSVRMRRDIRLIGRKTDASPLLGYADPHDKAYDCAERRKPETHPKTVATQ